MCISHRAPLFVVPNKFDFVGPVSINSESEFLIPDRHDIDSWSGKALSEYSQFLRFLSVYPWNSTSETIYIFQYRKFVSRKQPPKVAKNAQYAHLIVPTVAENYFPASNESLGSDSTKQQLTGPVLTTHSNLCVTYGKHHRPEDFAAFCACLVNVPDFGAARIRSFIECPYFIPAPVLGCYRVDFLLYLTKVLRTAWESYQPYFRARTGYQERVGGFLLERLHSFLLIEKMMRNPELFVSGYHVVCTDGDVLFPSG